MTGGLAGADASGDGRGIRTCPSAIPYPAGRPGPGRRDHAARSCGVLEPLHAGHVDDLGPRGPDTDEAHWTYLPMHRPEGRAEVAAVVAAMVDDPATVAYAVLLGGRASGVLSLMRIDPGNGVIEIGAVVLGTPLVRTVASTEAQRLLMGHVFDDLGYRRVEWKCDALNAPSRTAALRLGTRSKASSGRRP